MYAMSTRAHATTFTWAGEVCVDDLLHISVYEYSTKNLLTETFDSHSVVAGMLDQFANILSSVELTRVFPYGGCWEGERVWAVRSVATSEEPLLYVYVRLATVSERDSHNARQIESHMGLALKNMSV